MLDPQHLDDTQNILMTNKTQHLDDLQMRAAAGKAAPWPLNYVTLGNEACLRPWYKQHYTRFSTVLRAALPHIKLLANCDLGEGADFDMWEFHAYRCRAPAPVVFLQTVGRSEHPFLEVCLSQNWPNCPAHTAVTSLHHKLPCSAGLSLHPRLWVGSSCLTLETRELKDLAFRV